MNQLASLIREILPAWLWRRSKPQSGDAKTAVGSLRSYDADAVSAKAVEKDLFGADTADYAQTGGKGRNRH